MSETTDFYRWEQIVQSLYNENARMQHIISTSASHNINSSEHEKILTIESDGKIVLHKKISADVASAIIWENLIKFSHLMTKAQEDILAIRKLLNNFNGDIVEHVKVLVEQDRKNKLNKKYDEAMKAVD